MSFLSLAGIFASPWKLSIKMRSIMRLNCFHNVSLAQTTGHVWPSLNASLVPEQIFALLIGLTLHISLLVWTSVWGFFPMEMQSFSIDHLNSMASGPSASSLPSSGTSPVKGTHLFNHLNHWTGLSKYRIQKAGLCTSCANVLHWTNRM